MFILHFFLCLCLKFESLNFGITENSTNFITVSIYKLSFNSNLIIVFNQEAHSFTGFRKIFPLTEKTTDTQMENYYRSEMNIEIKIIINTNSDYYGHLQSRN